jgi:2-polyprenyl-3-methyl-5-hydroxy-6-metoxy-1,4-benzoquinol methylase
MSKISFSDYSMQHVQFFDEDISDLLKLGLSLTNNVSHKLSILDLGCGDGRLLFALHKKGLLKHVNDIVGVDISETRVKRLKNMLPFVKGITSNALNVGELSIFLF